MSESIFCPECNYEHSINEMELLSVYESDGCQTEMDCNNCLKPLVITSTVVEWEFEVEVNE